MKTTPRTRFRCSRLSVTVVTLATVLLPAGAQARPSTDGQAAPPVLGCGKAQALAMRYLAEQRVDDDASTREALSDTDVQHYDLDLEISNLDTWNNTCTITGTNVMTIESLSDSLTEFTFRLRDQYTITGAWINGTTPVSVATLSTTSRQATLDRTYTTGEVFTLTISFTGDSVSHGFGSIEVDTQGGTPVVATLSEPYYAYTWWPVKDGDVGDPGDNGDKATLTFSITAPNNYVVPSNGTLLGVDTLSGNRKRYNWSSNYLIAPYLVSFAATNYNTWTQTYTYPGGTMPVEFYIYPDNDTTGNRAAWEKVLDMLAVLGDLYGQYPFLDEKYGLYNFNFGGGMENQTITGLGTFSESVNAHELGHQWWGDMITCRTWHDIWLNEGFATYTECLWEEFKTGSSDPAAYFNAVQGHKPSSVADSVYVYDTSDVNRIFNYDYSYLKACWVLHQLRHVVGNDTFFQVLADYRAAYAYSAATTDEFSAVASATYGADLSWFFDQWVYQIGAPEYRFGWQDVNVNGQDYLLVRIRQTQTVSYPEVFIMPVDLEVTTTGGTETVTVWNDEADEWFVVPLGAQATDVAFDPDEWILRTGVFEESYQPGPPTIVETDPVPGQVLEEADAVDTVLVTFHADVDTVAGDYSLVGETGGAQAVTFSYDSGTSTATLTTTGPLPADTYTLTVSDALTAVNSGAALDGEVTDSSDPAALPSGEGLPGGSAVVRFTVVCGFGDADCDGDVDLADFATFQLCYTGADQGPAEAGCAMMRLDADRDVDLADLAAFEGLLTGP